MSSMLCFISICAALVFALHAKMLEFLKGRQRCGMSASGQ